MGNRGWSGAIDEPSRVMAIVLHLADCRMPLGWNGRLRNHSRPRLPVRDSLIVVPELRRIGRHVDCRSLVGGSLPIYSLTGPSIWVTFLI